MQRITIDVSLGQNMGGSRDALIKKHRWDD